MPVFYVHDVRQGNITPLDRRFKVHSVSAGTELNQEQVVHQQPEDGRNRDAQQQAALLYQNNLTTNYDGLGYVKEIMTSPVLTIKKTEYLSSAWRMMRQHEIHHLAVLDLNNGYCGMLSEKNILPYTMAHPHIHPGEIPLKVFCQDTMLSTHPDTLISDLARALLEYGLDSIAVTNNEQGQETLVGIVTYSDILKIILKSKVLGVQA